MIWFTSDLHIGHVNILEYTERPYDSLDEMHEGFIQNWNAVVAPEDEVYIVGDTVMGKKDDNLPILDRFNGRKHLVLGNHDALWPANKPSFIEKWEPKYKPHFETINFHLLMNIAGQEVELIHLPFEETDHDEGRWQKLDRYRPVDEGQWIIHGHLHCSDHLTGERQIHVGIDADWTSLGVERFTPIPLSAIEEVINGC